MEIVLPKSSSWYVVLSSQKAALDDAISLQRRAGLGDVEVNFVVRRIVFGIAIILSTKKNVKNVKTMVLSCLPCYAMSQTD